MVPPFHKPSLRMHLDMVQRATAGTAIALHLGTRTSPATATKALDLGSPTTDRGMVAVDLETRHTRETVCPTIVRTVGEGFEIEQETQGTLDGIDGMAGHDHEAPTEGIGRASGTVICTGGRIACTIIPHRPCVTEQRFKESFHCLDAGSGFSLLPFLFNLFFFSFFGNDLAHSGLVRLTLVLYNMHGVGGSPRQGDAEGRLGSHEHLHGVSLLRCLHIDCRQ